MTATGDDLAQLIAAELDSPVPRGAQLVAERIRARHGDGVRAIVFYGSCLRTGDDEFSLLDLYVLVDSYWTLGTSRLYAALNALLPPNVYYTEFADGERTLRAKYALVTVDDLPVIPRRAPFSLFRRFAQPCSGLRRRMRRRKR
jgi:predicted nucleotidyltransferase